MKSITKIVFTGGPCGGKTKAIKWMTNHFTEKGYGVIVVPESATELITSGVSPWTCGSGKVFQRFVLKMQLFKEKIYGEAAESLPQDDVLLIFDRGIMDGKAYVTEEEFAEILENEGIIEEEVFGRYDVIFHLVSTAKGEPESYSLKSNDARTETVEEAAALDDKILKIWNAHPQQKVIGTAPRSDEKYAMLEQKIQEFINS